jgi:hypothetical protein
MAATAAAALTLPLAALAAPAAGAAVVRAGEAPAARTAAGTNPSCPWLDQSLPVQQRVSMLMAQMTLADKINMVTGAGLASQVLLSGSTTLATAPGPWTLRHLQ